MAVYKDTHNSTGIDYVYSMISIIIPSYNSQATIRKCLTSLLRQTYRGDREIILVDSSTDDTPLIVGKEFPTVILQHFSSKTDPGTARNHGIELSHGEIIALIDSDCVAASQWLEKIAEAHQSGYHIVGGTVYNGNDSGDPVGLAGYLAEFREYIPGHRRQEMQHIPTCNISYRKKIFDTFGGFDGTWYPQEDLVFNYHLTRKQYRILFEPSVAVYHTHRSRFGDFTSHQLRIGDICARVLSHHDMKGSALARNPLLAVICSPLLYSIKFARTVLIFLRYQPLLTLKHLHVLPFFAIGLLFWTFGFLKGSIKNRHRHHLAGGSNAR